ncbi:transcriptional repressor [Candidatus Woesearchaeota archaeon]|nr:transcriptional repressor [Candidatus Woesearchaeota archaeon]
MGHLTYFKLTNQRAIIMEFLKDNINHPSVDDVYNYVVAKLPRTSKKTVYANLEFLAEKNIIKQIEVKGVKRYDPNIKEHYHLVCRSCHRIIDLLPTEINSKHKIDSVTMYGTCKNCLKRK